jgi:hypothetical protein
VLNAVDERKNTIARNSNRAGHSVPLCEGSRGYGGEGCREVNASVLIPSDFAHHASAVRRRGLSRGTGNLVHLVAQGRCPCRRYAHAQTGRAMAHSRRHARFFQDVSLMGKRSTGTAWSDGQPSETGPVLWCFLRRIIQFSSLSRSQSDQALNPAPDFAVSNRTGKRRLRIRPAQTVKNS